MSTASESSRGQRRRAAAATLASTVTLLLLLLAGAELALRATGEEPRLQPGDWLLLEADELEVDPGFFTDERGLFLADPDHYQDPDSGVVVNSQGFRSRPLVAEDLPEKEVLFVGDSFTWGVSARPLTSSFADLVDAADGFSVYNTGIPGTGPLQYAVLAETYAPILRPAVVAAVFYLGNDFGPPQPMVPGQALFHTTRPSWLCAFDSEGEPLTLAEAWAKHRRHAGVGSPLLQLLQRTRVGTRLAKAARGEPRYACRFDTESGRGQIAHARECLSRIRAAAHAVGARFVLFLVPVDPREVNPGNDLETQLAAFEGFDPRWPNDLDESWYGPPKAYNHFDNTGHAHYARFVLEVLTEE